MTNTSRKEISELETCSKYMTRYKDIPTYRINVRTIKYEV